MKSNGFQQAVVDQLPREDRSLPVTGFHTGAQKYDETLGTLSLSAGMANGAWHIPAGGDPHASGCECGWCALVRELHLHPHSQDTDCLMALWVCESAARKGRGPLLIDSRILNPDDSRYPGNPNSRSVWNPIRVRSREEAKRASMCF